jgi:dCTP deaminase
VNLLKDDDLVALVARENNPIVQYRVKPRWLPEDANDPAWYREDSPVQPSSLDLHIGAIYIPGVKEGKPGSARNPKPDHTLKFGHTAVVATLEELKLPKNIAGFGFPPSHVSFRGLLMINPGHVDPGYEGPLRFTVINVGKDDIPLREGELIFTLLLIELVADVTRGFFERRADSNRPASTQEQREKNLQTDLERLSLNFLDVESRTQSAAQKAVRDAGLKGPIWAAIIVALITLIGGVFGAVYSAINPVSRVEEQVKLLNQTVGLDSPRKLNEEIQALTKKVSDLENQVSELKKGGNVGEKQ